MGGILKVTAVTCPFYRGEIKYHRGDFANAPRCVLEAIGLRWIIASFYPSLKNQTAWPFLP